MPCVRKLDMDETAWQAATDVRTEPDQVQRLLEPGTAPVFDPAPRLEAIKGEMAALLTRVAHYGLADDVVQAALEPLQLEQARLLANAPAQAVAVNASPDLLRACQNLATRMRGITETGERRRILLDLRVKLEVQPGGTVNITELSLPVAY